MLWSVVPFEALRFAEHRIDFEILRDLTDQDLKDELGIVRLGALLTNSPIGYVANSTRKNLVNRL
jgi:hypothetical protein